MQNLTLERPLTTGFGKNLVCVCVPFMICSKYLGTKPNNLYVVLPDGTSIRKTTSVSSNNLSESRSEWERLGIPKERETGEELEDLSAQKKDRNSSFFAQNYILKRLASVVIYHELFLSCCLGDIYKSINKYWSCTSWIFSFPFINV